MENQKRKTQNQPLAALDDFSGPVGGPRRIRPRDPAQLAAVRLLANALSAGSATFDHAGRDGVIVLVQVPDVSWTTLVQTAWQVGARKDGKPEDGMRGRFWRDADWYSWAPVESHGGYAVQNGAELFAEAVAAGLHCVGFTSNLAWLPSDLILCADHHLKLLPLNGADVVAIAEGICGDKAAETISDEQAAGLTPRLLRLARRPNQTASDYLHKIQEVLGRDRKIDNEPVKVPAPSGTVRQSPTLERLHGVSAAVSWGRALAHDLRQFQEGKLPWADVDRGVLLSGPPGTGKTLFARALAATCAVPLVTGSYGEWLGTGSAHQGDLLKAMRKTFAAARDAAPSILFVDEVDSFPNRSTLTHKWADWEIQVVNALLSEIDGVEGRDGVVLVAACNHPDRLDPALTRSGRLDRHIRISLPDVPALAAILREHLGAELAGVNLLPAALAGAGSTGADAERFVRGARRRARSAGRDLMLDDLMVEIGGDGGRSPRDLWITAIHEAGHAVACCEVLPGTLSAISLRRVGETAGFTAITGSSVYSNASDIRARLIFMLAGRAAEELFLGHPSSGAGGGPDSDLAITTRLATTAAAALGLDPESGLIWTGLPDAASLPQMLREMPDLAARVRDTVTEAYSAATQLIRRRASAVEALAAALLERRALAGSEAEAIVAQHVRDAVRASP
jgi:hypothetical protein